MVNLPSTHLTNNFVTGTGISPKKRHEIEQLSRQIHNTCGGTDVEVLVDVGAGLGYLSQSLHQQFNYKILGLEADEQRVRAAQSRQQKHFPESREFVKFTEHFIDSCSAEFIADSIRTHFPGHSNRRLAIIGLHACADLTIAAIRLFLTMDSVKTVLIMPCCYHKMKMMDDTHFYNIPLSNAMQNASDCWASVLSRPFLRLASQQTAVRWNVQTEAEHSVHGGNMFERAALDGALNDGKNL